MSPSPPIRLCIWMQLPLQFWAQKSHSFYFADRSKTALDRPVNTGWDNPRAVVRKYERFAKSRPTHECEICLKYLDADRRRGKVDKSELTLFLGLNLECTALVLYFLSDMYHPLRPRASVEKSNSKCCDSNCKDTSSPSLPVRRCNAMQWTGGQLQT